MLSSLANRLAVRPPPQQGVLRASLLGGRVANVLANLVSTMSIKEPPEETIHIARASGASALVSREEKATFFIIFVLLFLNFRVFWL